MKTRVPKTCGEPRYEPVLTLPPLPPEQYAALRDNIALNGVLVPILVDGGGQRRRIIDGNHRKRIATDLGYDCPEVVQAGLAEDELRTLARALNLARRQLTTEQKRQLIADQLAETPGRSNRWVGRQLGVHHATVASVRADLNATGQIIQLDRTVGQDGRARPARKAPRVVLRPAAERRARVAATTLRHGDCRSELQKVATQSVDAVISDPIYPGIDRAYGRISEADWHALMRAVVGECRRVLKPSGSAVFLLQPNYEAVGRMRLWLWDFLLWAARDWNLIQDVYWWSVDAMPLSGTKRHQGLLRQSVKTCVWLGPPGCYRNQDNVLWTPSQATSARDRADHALRGRTHSCRNSTVSRAADERGGTTPFNCLPIPCGPGSPGCEGHPAATPYEVAAWWCRYILPPGGVLLDPFVGSGTMLLAGLDQGASRVIGIDRERKYLEIAERRVREG